MPNNFYGTLCCCNSIASAIEVAFRVLQQNRILAICPIGTKEIYSHLDRNVHSQNDHATLSDHLREKRVIENL